MDNQEAVHHAALDRGAQCDVAAFVSAETDRRALQARLEKLNMRTNALARDGALSADEKRAQGQKLRKEKQALSHELNEKSDLAEHLLAGIPNLIHADTPRGDETHAREIKRGACAVPGFDFEPVDHVVLGERLGMFDFKAGSLVAGPGFYFLLGDGARLELALQNYALSKLMARGFTPVMPPELVHEEMLFGAGYQPRGDEANSYVIEGTDLHLIATSEIPLCAMFAGEIIDGGRLPLRLAGVSHCFRSERAAGRATRGLFRVHQFNKVEMLVICDPDESEKLHEDLLSLECEIFDELEIPYRVVDVASGDLGAPAYRKYDVEAWMPGRGDGGAWSEVTSASNCTDYQARRLKIRTQGADGKPIQPHILNGTGLATGRAMIALMENNQQKDGAIRIPQALVSFFGKEIIKI